MELVNVMNPATMSIEQIDADSISNWQDKYLHVSGCLFEGSKLDLDKVVPAVTIVDGMGATPSDIEDIKELREKYREVNGKGVPPRYINDAEWIKDHL